MMDGYCCIRDDLVYIDEVTFDDPNYLIDVSAVVAFVALCMYVIRTKLLNAISVFAIQYVIVSIYIYICNILFSSLLSLRRKEQALTLQVLYLFSSGESLYYMESLRVFFGVRISLIANIL